MKNKEKFIQLFFIIVIVAGLAAVPMMIIGEQRASVPLFFWSPDNKNDTVLKAQNKLTELGLYTGNISGLFGLRTRSAIIRFQEENNLTANGILDIPTQELLFSMELPPAYQTVSYTEIGNQYLLEWINYVYGQGGKRIELIGNLTMGSEDISYGGSDMTTRLILEVDGDKYAVMNISANNLGQYVGQQVLINGFYVGYSSNEEIPMVFINYVNEGEETSVPIFIDYTREGNQYLNKWINKVYHEQTTGFVGLSGVLSTGAKVQYGPNGHTTNLVLTAQDGVQYSLENISANTALLEALVGQEIMIRGAILANTNSLGMKTVVINYVLDTGPSDPTAVNSLAN